MSVVEKIYASAKAMQGLSKSIIQKAERYHLAKASPDFGSAVSQIKEMTEIEKKFLPLKLVTPQAMLPASVDAKTESMYQHNTRAIEHANKALLFSGQARASKLVDAREEIRSGINDAEDVLGIKRDVTDKLIRHQLLPTAANSNEIISTKLIPSIKKFHEINSKIAKIIDPNDSIRIDANLTKQVLKQNSIGFFPIIADPPRRFRIYMEFI
jgi:hypothetical protein